MVFQRGQRDNRHPHDAQQKIPAAFRAEAQDEVEFDAHQQQSSCLAAKQAEQVFRKRTVAVHCAEHHRQNNTEQKHRGVKRKADRELAAHDIAPRDRQRQAEPVPAVGVIRAHQRRRTHDRQHRDQERYECAASIGKRRDCHDSEYPQKRLHRAADIHPVRKKHRFHRTSSPFVRNIMICSTLTGSTGQFSGMPSRLTSASQPNAPFRTARTASGSSAFSCSSVQRSTP